MHGTPRLAASHRTYYSVNIISAYGVFLDSYSFIVVLVVVDIIRIKCLFVPFARGMSVGTAVVSK